MTPLQIRRALRSKGITITALAKCLGCTQQHVSSIVAGKGTSRRVALAIAKILDKPVEEIFPDRPGYAERPLATKAELRRLQNTLRESA